LKTIKGRNLAVKLFMWENYFGRKTILVLKLFWLENYYDKKIILTGKTFLWETILVGKLFECYFGRKTF